MHVSTFLARSQVQVFNSQLAGHQVSNHNLVFALNIGGEGELDERE